MPNASERALKEHISKVGLGNPNVQATVEGDKVIVTGEVASQEEKEKILLAVGNIAGVGSVDDQITVTGPVVRRRALSPSKRATPSARFPRRVRRRKQVQQNLRGQQANAFAPGQDLSGAGVADS